MAKRSIHTEYWQAAKAMLQAYGEWFDRLMRGNFGIVAVGVGVVLWTLILSGSLPS